MIDVVRQSNARFVGMLPAIRRQARRAFRKVNPVDRADLVADVVAQAFCAYRRLVERGKESLAYATPLAQYAIKRLNDGRRVTGQDRAGEAMSFFCQRSGGFRTFIVAETFFDAMADERANPADVVALRLDFGDWLQTRSAGDRQLIAFLAIGNRPSDAASQFQVSRARISQRRRELGESWERFQGE